MLALELAGLRVFCFLPFLGVIRSTTTTLVPLVLELVYDERADSSLVRLRTGLVAEAAP